MRALATAVLVSFLALMLRPALAEELAALTNRSEAQKKEDAEVDKAYKAATRGDANATKKVDPWAIVRPGGETGSDKKAEGDKKIEGDKKLEGDKKAKDKKADLDKKTKLDKKAKVDKKPEGEKSAQMDKKPDADKK